jgi:protein ImuB
MEDGWGEAFFLRCAVRQIMCVRLREWPIERMRRKLRQSRREPLVLVRETASRLLVICASGEAKARGVAPGMMLAAARALCPGLMHATYEPERDARVLENLARRMNRFSPVVALEMGDAMLLDMTGSERLFAGLGNAIKRVMEGMKKLGLSCRVAIAPTPGAAWAVASFGPHSGVMVAEDQLAESLSALPVRALRLGEELVAALRALGIETVGQLSALPRKDLPARFGAALLMRLDQALGHVTEPLVGVRSRRPIHAVLEFESPVESLEVLWEVFRRLIAQVIGELRERGQGAKRLVAGFVPERSAPVRKEIHFAQANADGYVWFNLLRCAAENVRPEDGFVKLSLSVLAAERLTTEQLDLLEREARPDGPEFSHLVERLRLRLGDGAVARTELCASHLPERAFALTGVMPGKQGGQGAGAGRKAAQAADRPLKPRPLHLLAQPTEVRCMLSPSANCDGLPASFVHEDRRFDVACLRGPERIAGVWWEGRNKTRDYFDLEDTTGRRFWIFRVLETRKWYLHGIFDC